MQTVSKVPGGGELQPSTLMVDPEGGLTVSPQGASGFSTGKYSEYTKSSWWTLPQPMQAAIVQTEREVCALRVLLFSAAANAWRAL